jgi:DNA (cytosine-5)-methyltransferase 1
MPHNAARKSATPQDFGMGRMKSINIADLFCGAGGTSTGCILAARELGLDITLLAVNHWPLAVETHKRNHPWAQHLCADLGSVDPSRVVPGGSLRLLVASPECTHHSVARGGKPCNDQSRASAWHVLHWAERLRIENILIENVGEFQTWGPLGRDGRPDKSRKGQTFRAFIAALESLGYTVEWKILNAADYGDATTRRRLFIQARRGKQPTWPTASHQGKWRAAKEIIDWTLKGQSIFRRKRPLSANTMRRIEAGLRKFCGEPFLTILNGTNDDQINATAKSVDKPLPTLTTYGHVGLCRPFIVPTCHTGDTRTHSVDKPVPTITCGHRGELALVEPFILPNEGFFRGNQPRSIKEPLPTITASRGGGALVQPFLTSYYGNSKEAKSVDEPLATITTKDRFALVEPSDTGCKLDINFRMLQPHELAAAMGFEDYDFAGNKTEKVRQIGNAVPVNLAKALCKNILEG